MQAYLKKAKERCWKIYNKYYADNYKSHNAIYRDTVIQYLKPWMFLLDAGCGSKMEFTREFISKVRTAVGVDVEELTAVNGGPGAVHGDLNLLPFKDCAFDIIISKSVLEHLSDPERVFREFTRVLKKNGVIVFLTPNKYDYISFIAMATPFWFHRWILSKLVDRREEDIFPTYCQANTRRKILRLLTLNGLKPFDVMLFNQYPAYLMFSPFLFRLGIVYERVTSRYRILEQLRGWILVTAQKKRSSDDLLP